MTNYSHLELLFSRLLNYFQPLEFFHRDNGIYFLYSNSEVKEAKKTNTKILCTFSALDWIDILWNATTAEVNVNVAIFYIKISIKESCDFSWKKKSQGKEKTTVLTVKLAFLCKKHCLPVFHYIFHKNFTTHAKPRHFNTNHFKSYFSATLPCRDQESKVPETTFYLSQHKKFVLLQALCELEILRCVQHERRQPCLQKIKPLF